MTKPSPDLAARGAPSPEPTQEQRDLLELLRIFEPPISSKVPRAREVIEKIEALRAASAPSVADRSLPTRLEKLTRYYDSEVLAASTATELWVKFEDVRAVLRACSEGQSLAARSAPEGEK